MYAVNVLFATLAWVALSEAGVSPNTTHPGVIDYNYKSGGKYYKLHATAVTLSRALDICRQNGDVLAFPDTAEEKVALGVLRNSTRNAEIWVGAYIGRRKINGVYLTAGNLMRESYDSAAELPFVCELSSSVCNSSTPGYAVGPDGRTCYKPHTYFIIWLKSVNTCKAEGAGLAIANSQEEANHLVAIMRQSSIPAGIYSGFRELGEKGNFVTLDGDSLVDAGYEVWSEGEPNIYSHCGCVFRDGKLGVRSCKYNRDYFICERKVATLNYIPLE